jgi:hypothetical protein
MKTLTGLARFLPLVLGLLRASAVDLSTTNRQSLNGFFAAAEQAQRPVTVLAFGDSVADSYSSLPFVMMNQFVGRLGFAGCSLNNWANTLLINLTNGAQYLGPSDLWFSASVQIPPQGGVWWTREWSTNGLLSDKLGLFYVAQPEGGTFTLSASTNGGTWGPLLTLDGFSPSPIGCYTNVQTDLDFHMLRVDGISGTNIVLGPLVLNSQSPGVLVSFLDYPGIDVGQVTNVPLSIRVPILRALAPDLLIWHMKEDGSETTHQRLMECERWWSNAVPDCSVLYIGTPYVALDTNSTWTIDQNTVVRSVALDFHRAYVDCMTPAVSYPWMVASGFMADGTHPNLQGNQYLEGFAWDDLGFFALRAPRSLTLLPRTDGIQVSYATAPNILYALQSSADLIQWQAVFSALGDGSIFRTNLPVSSPGFLRLSLRPPPTPAEAE